MIGAVDELDFHVDDGKPEERSVLHRFLDALLNCWYIVLRNRTTDDVVLEFKTRSTREGFGIDLDVTVLSAPTRLTNELPFHLGGLGDRFTICNLRSSDTCIDPELASEPINNDLKMEFSHSGDLRLSRL